MTNTGKYVEMRWRILGHGGAIWSLEMNGERVDTPTTYVCDSFSELLRAAGDIKSGSEATYALLAGEPSGSILFLSRSGDQLQLRLVSFSAMSVAMTRFIDGTLRWHGSMPSKGFIDAVITMADAVQGEYGLQNFEQLWGHPFPLKRLAKLR